MIDQGFPLELPLELLFIIDDYYNKHRVLYDKTLKELSYHINYKKLVRELSGKTRYSGKVKWLKLNEYIVNDNKIITNKTLKLNYNRIGMSYSLVIYDLLSKKKRCIDPTNELNIDLFSEYQRLF